MKRRYLICLLVLIAPLALFGQSIELRFRLLDETTQNPIADAHVFVSDASTGTTSDNQGWCSINISPRETQSLIISHVSYKSIAVLPERYLKLTDGLSILMASNGVDLSEIQINAKRSTRWKKNFRKFRDALFGEGDAGAKCKILNPEVLRFEDVNGKLIVNAIDLLDIENNYLGYNINFWLEELSIEADGSKFYHGNGHFMDQTEVSPLQKKRREEQYQSSLAHFLSSLAVSSNEQDLGAFGYRVSTELYEKGKFSNIASPAPQELVIPDSIPGFYQLHFPEFLKVEHANIVMTITGYQMALSGAERQKFGGGATIAARSIHKNGVSRLYKIKPYLLFDRRGNIINKYAVKEYGYWANQRLATSLPIDYKKFSDFGPLNKVSQSMDTLQVFKDLIGVDQQKREAALLSMQSSWSDSYIAPLLDILNLSNNEWHQKEIAALFAQNAPDIVPEYFDGIQELWKNEPNYGSYYADFKAHLYSTIDPAFGRYFFARNQDAKIRLDEIVWGGVMQDGIPPLRNPKMVSATEASYLSDSDVVFGLVIDGEAYAYPKRILAWHEFFTDVIKEQTIAGVYCTLCGTVVIYNTEFKGVEHDLGTSGFLFRSNKLMYDRATQSLWSTIEGRPVFGTLVDQNIELSTLPIETTTWGQWRKRHPNTEVLSIETGHERNYEEGEAYKEYYATDALMFPVPEMDTRLANKARVFIPRSQAFAENPLAISVDYLMRKRLHEDQIAGDRVLIISEKNGASRAYAVDEHKFESYKDGVLLDTGRKVWEVTEEALLGPAGERLARLPAHESFWFAWVNAFPGTRLVR